jgi:hypothetical protein
MNRLVKFLVIVAATGAVGMAGAEKPDRAKAAGTPAGADTRFGPGISASYSFADIADLPAGAEHRLLSGDTLSRTPGGAWSELFHVNYPTPPRPAGASASGSLPGVASNPDGALEDSSAGDVRAAFSSGAGAAGWNRERVFPFPIDEIPEPSGWMLLLCGLAFAGFMTRRKRGPFAD